MHTNKGEGSATKRSFVVTVVRRIDCLCRNRKCIKVSTGLSLQNGEESELSAKRLMQGERGRQNGISMHTHCTISPH